MVGRLCRHPAPPSFPSRILGELVSIGTLLAFTIVCAGVWILRVRQPELHQPSQRRWCRWCRFWASSGLLYLMTNLPLITWEVMIAWLLVGLVAIYFTYSIKHSKVQQTVPDDLKVSGD